MSQKEYYFNCLSEGLQRHYAENLVKYCEPANKIHQFNLYLIDYEFISIDTQTFKTEFHSTENQAIDYCLDNRSEINLEG